MARTLLLAWAGLFVAWSCSSSGSGLKPQSSGAEGDPCPKDRSCDVNLACIDGKCMKPGGSGGSGGTSGVAGTAGGAGSAAGVGGAAGAGGAAGGAGSGGGGGSGASGRDASVGGAGGADGSAGAGGSGGGGAGGAGGTGGRGGTGGSGGVDAGADGPSCNGTHPLLDGGARYCKVGECRCEQSDSCYPRATVTACCQGAFRCFDADAAVQCQGTHPLIDGGRYCAVSNCYCPINDTCYPAAIASPCCNVAPTCRT